MNEKNVAEYSLLCEKLDEVIWALEGKCNDIDCDKYMYQSLLKKKYKPVLRHSYSCILSLKREKAALLRLLSMAKFYRFRYKRCDVCKNKIDSLGKSFAIVSFTRPAELKDRKVYEWGSAQVHKTCKIKVKTPPGWKTWP